VSILPVYPVVNTKTGEKKEVEMSIHDWDEWKNINQDWIRDWSDPSTCSSAVSEVGDWRNKTSDGWNDVLKKVGSVPGSKVKPLK
jgi:hypothetical protein